MRVLYAWEIGDNLGHVRRFFPIAEQLESQGAGLSYALCDLSRANFLRTNSRVRLYQAPCATRSRSPQRNNKSYPQLLFNHGFNDAEVLSTRLFAWRHLLAMDAPDVVVCDLAPVAQWAAQSMNIPTVNIGSGFECPPAIEGMPMYLGADPHSISEAAADERLVNRVIKTVCEKEGITPSSIESHLAGLSASLLATYPELDPYAPRSTAQYYGTWTGNTRSEQELSTPTQAPSIFCYLSYQPGIDFVIGALAGLDMQCSAFVPGLPDDFIDWLRAPNIQFLRTPANLAHMAGSVQLAITHGNHGTTSYFLSRGIPVIMLPLHVEQWAHALRIQIANLGRIVETNKVALFPKVVQELLHDAAVRANVKAFSERASKMADPIATMADVIARHSGGCRDATKYPTA